MFNAVPFQSNSIECRAKTAVFFSAAKKNIKSLPMANFSQGEVGFSLTFKWFQRALKRLKLIWAV